jgi:hypothetical protein
MDREIAELCVLGEAEQQTERADEKSPEQETASADPAKEVDLIKIRQNQRRFTAGSVLAGGGGLSGSVLEKREQRRQTEHAKRSPGVVQNLWGVGATTIMAGTS